MSGSLIELQARKKAEKESPSCRAPERQDQEEESITEKRRNEEKRTGKKRGRKRERD